MPSSVAASSAAGVVFAGDPSETATILVSGLEPPMSPQRLRTQFQGYGTIARLGVAPLLRVGFVEFDSRTDAEAALSGLDGKKGLSLTFGARMPPNADGVAVVR